MSPKPPDGAKLPVRATLRRVAAAYRARWRLLVGAAALVFLPLGALETIEEELLELDLAEAGAALDAAVAATVVVTVLLSTIGDQFYAGVVGEATRELRGGRSRLPLAQLLHSLPYGRLIVVDVVVTVAVAAGLLLLVVPGVLAFAWFVLAAPLVTIEGLGVRAALRRSRELVRGSVTRVLAILVPIAIATEALSELLQEAATATLGDGFTGAWIGSALAGAALAPVLALASVVLAYELIALRDPRAARVLALTAVPEAALRR